jgi:hypothetical protein
VQLYNLRDDLPEAHNLAPEQPQRVAQLTAVLQRLVDEGRSTPGPAQRNAVPVVIHPAAETGR